MRRVNEDEISIIIDKFTTGEYTIAKIAKEHELNTTRVRRILLKHGLSDFSTKSRLCRTFTINHNYFDIIDNERKAYWLGLLYADGNNNNKNSCIRIGLQEEDRELLEKFKIDVNSDKPLLFTEISKKNPKWKNSYTMAISSRNMSNRLVELGCIPAKSLILKFPTEEQVPAHLLRHFLRGMWDGDGSSSLYFTNSKMHMTANLVGTTNICENVKNLLNANNFKCSIYKRNDKTQVVVLTGNVNVYLFYKWLYNEAEIFMHRKYMKFKTQEGIISDRLLLSRQLRVAFRGVIF